MEGEQEVTTYASYYYEHDGQPRNGYQEHTSARAAIARATRLRDALPSRGGGSTVAVRIDADSDSATIYRWLEHAEGGYRTE